MSNNNNDLVNRSKWRIIKEIEDIANNGPARKRKERLDKLLYERELRRELDGMEVLLNEI
jgi:hypothetical protein